MITMVGKKIHISRQSTLTNNLRNGVLCNVALSFLKLDTTLTLFQQLYNNLVRYLVHCIQ